MMLLIQLMMLLIQLMMLLIQIMMLLIQLMMLLIQIMNDAIDTDHDALVGGVTLYVCGGSGLSMCVYFQVLETNCVVSLGKKSPNFPCWVDIV